MFLDNLTKGQFEASIKQMVLEAIKESGFTLEKQLNTNDEYSTMKQVTQHFKVTKPTIYNWKKKNLVTSYPHVGRILYKIKEIEETMGKMEIQLVSIPEDQESKDKARYLNLISNKAIGKMPNEDEVKFYTEFCKINNVPNLWS